jgi:hypothetical protein
VVVALLSLALNLLLTGVFILLVKALLAGSAPEKAAEELLASIPIEETVGSGAANDRND